MRTHLADELDDVELIARDGRVFELAVIAYLLSLIHISARA